jgi:hypothetical protein
VNLAGRDRYPYVPPFFMKEENKLQLEKLVFEFLKQDRERKINEVWNHWDSIIQKECEKFLDSP